jgi:hypothetical protein
MALINTVPLEKAEGTIKEADDMFVQNLGVIPRLSEMMRASPAIFSCGDQIPELNGHPVNLNVRLNF